MWDDIRDRLGPWPCGRISSQMGLPDIRGHCVPRRYTICCGALSCTDHGCCADARVVSHWQNHAPPGVQLFSHFCHILNETDISHAGRADRLSALLSDVLTDAAERLTKIKEEVLDWNQILTGNHHKFYAILVGPNGWNNDGIINGLEGAVSASLLQAFRMSRHFPLFAIFKRLLIDGPTVFSSSSRIDKWLNIVVVLQNIEGSLQCPSPRIADYVMVTLWAAIIAPVKLSEFVAWDYANCTARASGVLDSVISRLQSHPHFLAVLSVHHYRRILALISDMRNRQLPRSIFSGVLATLIATMARLTHLFERNRGQVDPAGLNQAFLQVEVATKYLELVGPYLSHYQRGSLVRCVLTVLTHLPLRGLIYIGIFGLLDPLIWPLVPIHSHGPLQKMHHPDSEAALTFLNNKGLDTLVTPVTKAPQCPMKYLALSFRLLLVALKFDKCKMENSQNGKIGQNAQLIENFTWYHNVATDLHHLRASLLPTIDNCSAPRDKAFALLTDWPGDATELPDRILLALSPCENMSACPTPAKLRRDFFTSHQSWDRIRTVFDLSLYVITNTKSPGVLDAFRSLFLDSAAVFEQRAALQRELDHLIRRVSIVLSNPHKHEPRYEPVVACVLWINRVCDFTEAKDENRFAQLRSTFNKFLSSLGLLGRFYNSEGTSALQGVYGLDSFFRPASPPRSFHWDKFSAALSTHHSWRFPHLMLLPIYILRAEADYITATAQQWRAYRDSLAEMEAAARHGDVRYAEVMDPSRGRPDIGSCLPDWAKSSSVLRDVINSLRKPLMQFHQLFGYLFATDSQAYCKDKLLPVFALFQVLISFDAVDRYLMGSMTARLLPEVKGPTLLLIGYFLVVTETLTRDPTTFPLFFNLAGTTLLVHAVDLLSKIEIESSRKDSIGSQMRGLLTGDLGDLSARLLRIVGDLAEDCILDESSFQTYKPAFTEMLMRAKATLRLSLFNAIITPLAGGGFQSEAIALVPWKPTLETILVTSGLAATIPGGLRRIALELIKQLLQYEQEEYLDGRIKRRSLVEVIFTSCPSVVRLLPCCANVAEPAARMCHGRYFEREDCPSCGKFRAKEQPLLWALNLVALPTALSLRFNYIISDDVLVLRSCLQNPLFCVEPSNSCQGNSCQDLLEVCSTTDSSPTTANCDAYDVSFGSQEEGKLYPKAHDFHLLASLPRGCLQLILTFLTFDSTGIDCFYSNYV